MDDERDPNEPDALSRRTWIALTTVGAPALIGGCADDVPTAELGDSDSESGGSDDEVGDTGTESSSETGTDESESESTSDTDMDDTDSESESESDTGEEVWDPEAVPEDSDLFPRTIMAGDMTADAFVVALYIDDAAPKTLRVWSLGELEDEVVVVDERELVPDADGFAKARIDGLEPGTWYRYAVFAGAAPDFDGRSLIGLVKTALAGDQIEPVTVAFGSCIGTGTPLPGFIDPDNPTPQQWPITDMAQDLEFDLFIQLGDQGYMDTVWNKGGGYEQYLSAWGACHGGGYRKLYPKAGIVTTWDDHEVVDNSAVDPWTSDPGDLDKIDNAMRAYYRALPIDADAPSDAPIWRSFQWGEVVEFVVLDTRYERQPEPNLAFMSPEQRMWLHERLLESPCQFVCVCTPKPYADIKLLLGDYPGGDERWSGHAEDRDAIKDLVNQHGLDHVVWVTGDIHMSYVGVTDRDDDSIAGNMVEVCCTSGNTNPLGELLSPEQFDYNTAAPRMPVLTFDPVSDEVLVRMYDSDGGIAFETTLTWS